VKPWLRYTIIRVSLFAATLAALLLLGVNGALAAILAAVIGLCIAYIFFRPARDALVNSALRPSAGQSMDEDAEDGESPA
jgi:choline-glycine betaine transporter